MPKPRRNYFPDTTTTILYEKIYFRDPLFLHAWNTARRQESIFRVSLAYAEETNIKSRIAEQTATGHITRLAFNISRNKIMHSDQLSVFYWSSKNNNRVDFAVRNGNDIIPIEVQKPYTHRGHVRND